MNKYARMMQLKKELERRKEAEANLKKIVGGGYDEFWNDKSRYRVLKGGRGSKKSTTTALWFIWHIMKHPLANAVAVRKTFNTNKDSTWAQLKWAARKLDVYDKWDFKVSPLEAVYKPTGQKILFRGFDDPLKLTSMTVDVGELCWVWMEEAFEIDKEEDFDTFDESIRGEMPEGLWKQITITYNPWISSHWTKTRFWDGECPPNTFRLTTTYKCNEYLDDADRQKIEDLEHTNPARYKVVGLGEYGMPGGTYFDEFSESVHVIKPFVIDENWRRYRVLDYGLDMLACYWIAIDYQGKGYIYKELHESGHIVSQAAKRILEVTIEPIHQTFAPPDLWNRRNDTGKSAAQIFQENGIYLSQAENGRVQGCLDLKEWLFPYDTKDELTGEVIKTTNLKVFNNCVNLIKSLENIQKDEKDPNVYATEPHILTHSIDAIRYFVAGRPRPPRMEVKKKNNLWMFETKQEGSGFIEW